MFSLSPLISHPPHIGLTYFLSTRDNNINLWENNACFQGLNVGEGVAGELGPLPQTALEMRPLY